MKTTRILSLLLALGAAPLSAAGRNRTRRPLGRAELLAGERSSPASAATRGLPLTAARSAARRHEAPELLLSRISARREDSRE